MADAVVAVRIVDGLLLQFNGRSNQLKHHSVFRKPPALGGQWRVVHAEPVEHVLHRDVPLPALYGFVKGDAVVVYHEPTPDEVA